MTVLVQRGLFDDVSRKGTQPFSTNRTETSRSPKTKIHTEQSAIDKIYELAGNRIPTYRGKPQNIHDITIRAAFKNANEQHRLEEFTEALSLLFNSDYLSFRFGSHRSIPSQYDAVLTASEKLSEAYNILDDLHSRDIYDHFSSGLKDYRDIVINRRLRDKAAIGLANIVGIDNNDIKARSFLMNERINPVKRLVWALRYSRGLTPGQQEQF